MFFLSLLSTVVFVVPVFVTFGVYFGVDHARILRCGFHCGQPSNNPLAPGGGYGGGGPGSGSGGNPTPSPDDIVGSIYCQKSYAIQPPPGRYIFNPNQWGDTGNVGALCINFTSEGFDDRRDYAPGWSATWQYPIGTAELPVHAFPNADLHVEELPTTLSDMSGLTLDVAWSYGVGSNVKLVTNFKALNRVELNANVCVDMFLAPNKDQAKSTTKATHEVMVWLGRIGPATDPLGYELGVIDTKIINGTTFNLYSEDNSLGQHTFTWLAAQNTTEFTGDIAPLLKDLSTQEDGPTGNDYLGYIAFGSEAFSSNRNVTFYVPKLDMDVIAS